MGGKRAIRQAPCRSSDYQITVNNITNEALDSNPCIPVQDGYPVQYSCLGDVANDTVVEPLMVSFNYEVWINEVGATMGIMQNIRALEWSILYNVAVAISLDKCKLSNQRIPRRLARGDDDIPRWRQLQNNSTNVVYLSNQDPGVVNLRTGSCVSQPPTASTVCVPVGGTMSAEYTGNDPFAVEAFLKDTIAQEMSRKTILINDVIGVHYVGDNSSYQSVNPQGSQPTNVSGVAIGVTTVAVSIILLGLFAVLRKRSVSKDDEVFEIGRDGLERVDQDNDDDEDDDDEPEDLSTHTDEAIIVGGHVTELTDMTDEMVNAQVESKSRSLPSRAKRTRKKKKKKKQKIVRVSSRISVDEMETITEEFEETGDSTTYCNTDDGSAEFQPHDPWISGPIGPTRLLPLTMANFDALDEPVRLPPSPIIEEKRIRRLPPPWV